MRPNIFDIATSELSQDAFLCWLLTCADVSHKVNCPELHALGQALLGEIFFRANDRTPPAAITSVKPRRQSNDIDILCTVNGNIAIAIEDKTGTVESPHQLEKYRRHALEKLGYLGPIMRAVFVYIQTGNQGDYDGVRKAGYLILERTDLLNLLKEPVGTAARHCSDIVDDFANHLSRIESEVQSYKTRLPEKWNANARMGFLEAVQRQSGRGRWKYVSNEAGGLYVLYWPATLAPDHCKLYLQVEAADGRLNLCFKISVPDTGDDLRLRNQWHANVTGAGKRIGRTTRRPVKFGTGETMTVALLDHFPPLNENCVVDVSRAAALIWSAQALIDQCFVQVDAATTTLATLPSGLPDAVAS